MGKLNNLLFELDYKYLRTFLQGFDTGAMAFKDWLRLVLAEDYDPNLHWWFFTALNDHKELEEIGFFDPYPVPLA